MPCISLASPLLPQANNFHSGHTYSLPFFPTINFSHSFACLWVSAKTQAVVADPLVIVSAKYVAFAFIIALVFVYVFILMQKSCSWLFRHCGGVGLQI